MAIARSIGTAAFGIRAPIIREGVDLAPVVVDSLLQAAGSGALQIKDRDVIGVTESLLARAQGNYVHLDDLARETAQKIPGDFVILFPILSRNRFSLILKGLARSGRKITVMLSYPSDEVGNQLMDIDKMDEAGINPYSDILTEADYRRHFKHDFKHPFTGLDYIDLYKQLAVNNNIEIVLANDYKAALRYAPNILVANIHDRDRLKQHLRKAGAQTVLALDDLMCEPRDGSGYNPDYGLLGSNQAGDDRLKLFPRDCDSFVNRVQKLIREETGRHVEVMVYGDGAFKDPQGKIWELADPVVSPGFTDGLLGTPNEIKMKYVVDNELAGVEPALATEMLRQKIRDKKADLVGQAASLGTTPRQMTDLLGSLCDLISGSGDKGTPIILIQGYFDNYASD
jgi:F420-0:gamma-glutamyl ligase